MAWTVKSSVLHISLEDCVKKNVDVPRAIRSEDTKIAHLSESKHRFVDLDMKMYSNLCLHGKTEP